MAPLKERKKEKPKQVYKSKQSKTIYRWLAVFLSGATGAQHPPPPFAAAAYLVRGAEVMMVAPQFFQLGKSTILSRYLLSHFQSFSLSYWRCWSQNQSIVIYGYLGTYLPEREQAQLLQSCFVIWKTKCSKLVQEEHTPVFFTNNSNTHGWRGMPFYFILLIFFDDDNNNNSE